MVAKRKRVTKVKKVAAKRKVVAKVKPIPDNYPPLMAFSVLPRCGEAIDYYRRVFGAKERLRLPMPDGKVAHAELAFGPSVLMLADEMPSMGATASMPKLCLYVKNVDAVHSEAVATGSTSKQPPTNQFYGERSAKVLDPFGIEWMLMTRVENVSVAEMKRRMSKLDGQQAQ